MDNSDETICIVCEMNNKDWRSRLPLEEGLEASWTHDQLKLDYDSPDNELTIKVMFKSDMTKKVCHETVKVEHFLKNIGVVCVPLHHENILIGCIEFKTFEDTKLVTQSEDEKIDGLPHVLNNCIVCGDTHQSCHGLAYQCNNCVCFMCKGTGIRHGSDNECDKLETESNAFYYTI